MTISSLRVLCELEFPSETVRLWDGAGPMLDADGNIWLGAALGDTLDEIESAMNGEASTLTLSLISTDPTISDLAYEDLEGDNVIGGIVRIKIQPCDEFDQPDGPAETRFTGIIDNMPISDAVSADNPSTIITIECRNRFTLRNLTSGSVLSDVDQRARAKVLNPTAPDDRFCERVPLMADHTIWWPAWS